MRKLSLFIFSLLLLTACSGGAPSQSGTETNSQTQVQTVKLGVLAPLSGDAAALGAEMQKALDFDLNTINKKAASRGYKFELVYEDGKCSGAEAVTGFQKLTDINGVKFVIGGTCSSETLAVASIAQTNGILLMSPTSSNPDVEDMGDYVFSLSYSDELIGQTIAKELNKYGNVAVISEQNDFNVGLRKVALANLDADTKVVADETFAKGGTDFRNALEKIAAKKPEALFLNPNPGVTAENLLKQLAEIPALANVKLVTHYAYLGDPSRAGAVKTAEGMIIIDAPSLKSAKLDSTVEAIKAVSGTLDNLGLYYAASTLDDLDLMTQVIMQEGADPAKVKDALRKGTFEGYIGKISFGDYNFVQDVPAARFVVTDGKAVMK